ncbi:MAG TPA: hypothetical protein VGR95_07935 [Thermoanaerobaculia bacterium]|nr:hypothetical protein [Thermoanaerobaculia bacterium]
MLGFGVAQFVAAHRGETPIPQTAHQWQVIAVGSVEYDAALIHTISSEVAQRKKPQASLGAVVFATDTPQIIDEYVKRSAPRATILALRNNVETARRTLGVVDTQSQLYLLDPAGKVVFRGGKPRASDLKLLLQRYLPVAGAPQEPLKVGDSFRLPGVTNVRTLTSIAPPASPLLGIVFTGRCTACALETHMGTAKAVERAIEKRARQAGETPALLFTSYFNPNNLRSRVNDLGFHLDAYQVTADLPAIDDLVQRDGLDVVIVETNAAGQVSRLASLNDFLQNILEVKE